jgi:cephalosporin hydroxylase
MDPIKSFKEEVEEGIEAQGRNDALKKSAAEFMNQSIRSRYSYHFTWLGRPIIQYPQDIIAIQEIIYRVQPDLIIETGIAHGGSIIFHASICELIGKGHVVGVDIDIREHNKAEIENHKMYKRITMIQGSSIDPAIAAQVGKMANGKERVLVILDSNHTHHHVLEELKLYAPMVTMNSYLLVFDTIVEDLPADLYADRPWSIGNNPKSAIKEFFKTNDQFAIDHEMENKLLISVAPGGYLKRVR